MTPSGRRLLAFIVIAWIALTLFYFVLRAQALTPEERKIVQHAKEQLDIAIAHGGELEKAAEDAKNNAQISDNAASLATASAQTAGEKAEKAEKQAQEQHDELVKCAKENEEMRPIVAAVSGPWWFPGLNALFYGIKKCALSLTVIVLGLVVLVVVLCLAVPGLRPVLGAAGGIFGRLWKWLVSVITRKSKAVEDNIEHQTMGSDPPAPKP
jgi:hypothetical protein